MSQCLSIGATQHMDLLRDKLGKQFQFNKDNNLILKLTEKPAGNITFLSCDFSSTICCGGPLEDQELFRHFIADIISDLILNHWEKAIVRDIIRESYFFFNEDEKKTIYQYYQDYANDLKVLPGRMEHLDRKNIIIKKLVKFLEQNNSLVIDGFVRFRLKDYINEIKETVDQAVDDFLTEREYKEFIQLLKYFVEIQESKIDEVNILLNQKGTYQLLDQKYEPIDSEFLEGFIINVMDNEINYEDLLISALITIAPNKIVFHCCRQTKPQTTIDTIKHVFEGRVIECTGCQLCRNQQQ